ncbi:YqaA family protein [Litoribacillus peritrichatus]|uniref:YqaA family protein n=1 Tax=Litoribacillus peritrichatus TaxID=718191 RepID=A0ABP7MCJ7_9GAMM
MDFLLLFLSAFGAATILPFYSEVVLIGLLANDSENWFYYWLTASVGNTLGAWVNWAIGKYMLHYKEHKWFPFKGKALNTAQKWFQKYGVWSLLMAWAPIGGDAITFIAGIMRVNLGIFLTLTFIGKALRYLILVAATLELGLLDLL